MDNQRALNKAAASLTESIRWLCDRSPSPVAHLDEDTQRRLALRWAKERALDLLPGMRKHCPTAVEIEKHLRESIICSVVFCWWCCYLWVPSEIVKAIDLRHQLSEHWEAWLANPDPDCEQWALEAEIRRRLRAMPRKMRKSLGSVQTEVDRIAKTYQQLCKQRGQIDQALAGTDSTASDRRFALGETLDQESDTVTRASLERRLQAVEGQTQLLRQLESWKSRVASAQAECTDGLRHLRAQLALLAATEAGGASADVQALASLHELNGRLSATVAATEEVLHLGNAA